MQDVHPALEVLLIWRL